MQSIFIHLLFDFLFFFSFSFFLFDKVQANSGVIGNVPTPRFQRCVIIPLNQNSGIIGNVLTPLHLRKSSQSFLYIDAEEREREENQKHTDFTFQTCRRNLILCIQSPKTSRLSSIRLEINFGSIKHSQQVWIMGRWSTLVTLIHYAVNKFKSGAREWLDNK